MKSATLAMAVLALSLVCCSQLVSAQVDFSFDGNATVSDPDGTLNFRHTVVVIDPVLKFAGFRSLRAEISQGNAEIDTLGGFVSWAKIPFALLAYFDVDATWTTSSFSVDAARNVIAKAFLHLQERTPDGTVVKSFGFGGGVEGPLDWSITSNIDGELKYFSLYTDIHNNLTNSDFRVTVSFFVAEVKGQVNLANTTVTPRRIESVLRIAHYNYSDDANHLTLRVAVAHGSADLQISGNTVKSGADGLSQLYVSVSSECQLVADENARTGTVRAVTVSSFVAATADVKAQLTASSAAGYLTTKFQGNWDVKIVTIDFPAGAHHILYDPTIGASESKDTTSPAPTGSGSLLVPSMAFAFLGLLSLLF